MLTRTILSSGEKLPVIGLGTWRAFDVDLSADVRKQLEDVLSLFVKLGGRVIDSSPMYGRAEAVIGQLSSALGIREKLFLATKVWTEGKQSGIQSMERSMSLFRTNRIDLMQVHNLVDVNTQLATLQEWKQQGRIRYSGITHYESGALIEIEKLMRSQKFDFLQINYSLMEPEAEQRVLQLAQERGIAVIANRPFGAGDLFGKVRSKPLPDWAAEVSDPLLLFIIISTVCAGLAVRRQQQGGALRGTALTLTSIMLLAAFVAVWAMATKPT